MSEAARPWWVKSVMVGGVIAIVCLVVGALGYRVGVLGIQAGLFLSAAGVALGALTVVIGIICAIVVMAKSMQGQMSTIVIGVVLGGICAFMMLPQIMKAGAVPPIHNISTDVDDPPQFDQVVALRGENSNPLEYDREALAEVQQQAYPDVKTLASDAAAADMLNRAHQVLQDLGLEIVNLDAAQGIVEATETTFWFGFKDDVVVRVRDAGAGSVVDVRSVSRVGQSDIGVNAERIVKILNALKG